MKMTGSSVRNLIAGTLIVCLILAVAATSFPFGVANLGQPRYETRIYTLASAVESLPDERVAIVYGARVYPSGRLSAMLRDRVDTAIALYEAGKAGTSYPQRRQRNRRI